MKSGHTQNGLCSLHGQAKLNYLFIEYATDHKCPKQAFFRFMLYYIVGFIFGYPQKQKSEIIREIELLVSHGKGINHGDIRKWVKQSKALLQGEITYTYDDWRGGLLANYYVFEEASC